MNVHPESENEESESQLRVLEERRNAADRVLALIREQIENQSYQPSKAQTIAASWVHYEIEALSFESDAFKEFLRLYPVRNQSFRILEEARISKIDQLKDITQKAEQGNYSLLRRLFLNRGIDLYRNNPRKNRSSRLGISLMELGDKILNEGKPFQPPSLPAWQDPQFNSNF